MKAEQLVYLMNYKVKWSIKEIDGLLWKIQQIMSEEDIVEFITNEKKIEHQYRTIQRLEKPLMSSVIKNDEINGFYECKDFMSKRLLNFREKSNPIAADGQIWSLECDFNGAVNGYVSIFIVN